MRRCGRGARPRRAARRGRRGRRAPQQLPRRVRAGRRRPLDCGWRRRSAAATQSGIEPMRDSRGSAAYRRRVTAVEVGARSRRSPRGEALASTRGDRRAATRMTPSAPGMLHAAFVRSPARTRACERVDASALPAGCVALPPEDVADSAATAARSRTSACWPMWRASPATSSPRWPHPTARPARAPRARSRSTYEELPAVFDAVEAVAPRRAAAASAAPAASARTRSRSASARSPAPTSATASGSPRRRRAGLRARPT